MVKETKLKILTKKEKDFAKWYTEVITKSELISYYEDVSGCYILRPNAMAIWEKIQRFLDDQIKAVGVQPCYFPMFVGKGALEREQDHIDDFSPEVAWVTKCGDSELENPVAIRPTSETIMYPAYSTWIKSHRDLPLRLNQWTNVVRWEFKNPTPFLRTREFLWQEGHSAFSNQEEADEEVLEILDFYARVYEELLAVPVIKGRKSDKEKFAGGDYTTTVEAYIPGSGRAIQGATSHSLGQNFSKMFNITFESDKGTKGNFVYQNSWGLTTRTIGVMIMVHGDNDGLVLPPRVASLQVVVIFILYKDDAVNEKIVKRCEEISKALADAGISVKFDTRRDKNPGWKYAHYEQRGVPLRIEIGAKDLENNSCLMVRRDTRAKESVQLDSVVPTVQATLERMQQEMLDKARKERDEHIAVAWNFDEFMAALSRGDLVLTPWCMTTESEELVKELSANSAPAVEDNQTNANGETKSLTGAAKTLCIPFNQPPLPAGTKCFTGNGADAKEWCLWGRSY